jgi:hypothetical protein
MRWVPRCISPTLVATELERTKKFTPAAMAEGRALCNERIPADAGGAASRAGDKAKAFYGTCRRMTGLPVDVVAKSRGWIRNAYCSSLRENGQSVSSYDATFRRARSLSESVRRGGGDPILDGFTRALSGAFVGYARDELGFKTDMTYTLLRIGSFVEVGVGRPARAAGCQRRSSRTAGVSRHPSGCWCALAGPTSSRPMA